MKTTTYNKLVHSLSTILQTTPYEEITVVSLCHHAHITRRTFYNHFKNIDDFVHHLFLDIFTKECLAQTTDETYFQSDAFINAMIHVWDEYGDLFLGLEKWNVLEYLTKDNVEIITSLIKQNISDDFIRQYSDYFIASSYSNVVQLCMVWIKKGKVESKDELKKIIKTFLFHRY